MLLPEWQSTPIDREAYPSDIGLTIQGHWSIPRNRLRSLSNHLYLREVVPGLRRIIDDFGPDLIHAHNELPAAAALRATIGQRPPVVMSLHGVDLQPRLRTPAYKGFQRAVLGRVDRVILVGEPLRSFYSPLSDRQDHFRVVHNGCRMPRDGLRPRTERGNQPLRFVSVSNLVEGKGIDITLRALRRLDETGRTCWTYAVVGEGPAREELEQLARDLRVADRVHFAGACDHEEVYRRLAAAEVFVLPSCPEAFGIAYLEAMAVGLLTIGVEGQGPAAFIRHGETGLLVPPRDFMALALCLSDVLDARETFVPVAEAGRQLVHCKFSWHAHAERLTDVYRELVP